MVTHLFKVNAQNVWSIYPRQLYGNASYFPWSVDVPKGGIATCLLKIEVAGDIGRWDGHLDMSFVYAQSSNRHQKRVRSRVFVAPQDT